LRFFRDRLKRLLFYLFQVLEYLRYLFPADGLFSRLYRWRFGDGLLLHGFLLWGSGEKARAKESAEADGDKQKEKSRIGPGG